MKRRGIIIFLSLVQIIFCGFPSAIQLYRSQQQLEQNITALTQQNPAFRHQYCSSDPSIKYLTMSQGNDQAPNAIISCNVHAHQFITSELCLDLANNLSKNKPFLDNFTLTILYAANSNREVALNGDYSLRTDQNGVDPNRNFPIGFTTDTSGETFGGRAPLSQGFSQCLDQLANKLKPLVYIDFHSGQFSLVYYTMPEDGKNDPSEQILQRIKENYCKNCRVVDLSTIGLNGQAFQYMKYGRGVKYSNLFQIYGGYKAQLPHNELMLSIFNPLTWRQLQFYRDKWVGAVIGYFQLVAASEEREGK